MAQLHPKYLPAWKIFQSPFDKRTSSENDATAPVSYGINGNAVIGISTDKIARPSAFIVFAPAQSRGASVAFTGTRGDDRHRLQGCEFSGRGADWRNTKSPGADQRTLRRFARGQYDLDRFQDRHER